MQRLYWLFVVLLFAGGGLTDFDAIDNYCRLWNHQSIFKDGKIYIDGGDMVYADKNDDGIPYGAQYYGYMNQLLVLDVSRSWNWRVDGFGRDVYQRFYKGDTSATTNFVPIRRRGALCAGAADDNKIYLYGGTSSPLNKSFPGYYNPEAQAYPLWSFDTVSHQWTEYNDNQFLGLPSKLPNAGASVSAPGLGRSFYYGGQIDNGSSAEDQFIGNYSYPVSGLVVLDTHDQRAQNLSTKTTAEDVFKTRGGMTYVQNIGSHGVLVRLGGLGQSLREESDNATAPVMSLDLVEVLDLSFLDSDEQNQDLRWYQQRATGDIPEPRTDFCIVSVSAADNSSHHIYLYSGRNGRTFYDDVYILSMPSFQWTRIFQGESPRAFHTCHVVSGSRMITIGGLTSFDLLSGCDWENVGVGVFDLNKGIWGQQFNATNEPYRVQGRISAVIGGGPNGGANVTSPINGFDDASLNKLFNPNPPPLAPGYIALIAIGSTIVILAILGFMFRKRLMSWLRHPSTPRFCGCCGGRNNRRGDRRRQWWRPCGRDDESTGDADTFSSAAMTERGPDREAISEWRGEEHTHGGALRDEYGYRSGHVDREEYGLARMVPSRESSSNRARGRGGQEGQ